MSTDLNTQARLQVVHKYHLKNLLIQPVGRTSSFTQKNTASPLSVSTSLNYSQPNSPFFSPKKKSSFSPEPKISNFFDKTQINGMITSLDNFSKRINALDFIIQRQKEIKEAEDHFRMERSAPLIHKWTEGFHNRRKNKQNNKGNNFIKLVTDASARRPSEVLQTEGGSQSGRIRFLTLQPTQPNDFLTTEYEDLSALRRTSRCSEYQSDNEMDLSRDIKDENKSEYKNEKEKGTPELSLTKKLSHFSFLLNKKSRQDSIKPLTLDMSPTSRREPLSTEKPVPVVQVRRKVLSEAARFGQKNLENDILKYLVTNPGSEEECQAFLKASVTKEKTFKLIETKAKRQFLSLRNEDGGTQYSLPGSPTKKNSLNKLQEIIGTPNRNSITIRKEGFIPKTANGVRKPTKTFSLVKKTATDLDTEKPDHKRESKQGNLGESFISITETKLDNLYRENRKLQTSIKTLDSVLKDETEINKQKKIKKTIRTREGDLKNNSHEIMRMVLKKIGK